MYNELFIAFIIIFILVVVLNYILKTDFGIAMRATGNNPAMTKALGINNDRMKIIGLAIANSFTALSGFLVAQYQNFSDINMGIGIVITGLGTVLIADALRIWFNVSKIGAQLLLVLVGSLLFQLVLAFTLSLGIDPNLLKLVTAVFVLFIVALPNEQPVEKRLMAEVRTSPLPLPASRPNPRPYRHGRASPRGEGA